MTVTPAFAMPAPPAPAPAPAAQPAPPPPVATTPGPQPGPDPSIPHDVLANAYIRLRDKKAEITARHKKELEPINEAMEQVNNAMLNALNTGNAQSIKTAEGTFYRSTKNSYSIDDPAALREWVEANGRPDLYENRISKDAIEAFADQTGTLPPGVKMSTFVTVNVRK